MSDKEPLSGIDRLLEIMARLRDPADGCPWDVDQDFSTIAPYTIEEAYEVADAIEAGDREALKDELGDLLFQVVFHAQMAREEGTFSFDDVVAAVCDKMVRRHPHVFGDASIENAEAQTRAWEDHKAAERDDKSPSSSVLDDVPRALPALLRALKLQKRAARVGFDWQEAQPVFAKIEEEMAELRAELAAPDRDETAILAEFGDVLFAFVNLSRHLGVDPETALRTTNDKFERRFRAIEGKVTESGREISGYSLSELEALWNDIKRNEKT